MPLGPGKYDDLCTMVREEAGIPGIPAQGAIVIVVGGRLGAGFACQADAVTTIQLPSVLRAVAKADRGVGDLMEFRVQRKMCKTCIYLPTCTLDIKHLEDQVRERLRGRLIDFFKGFRRCHHSKTACCHGFWERHKDKFQLGQIAQRLNMVEFVDDDVL